MGITEIFNAGIENNFLEHVITSNQKLLMVTPSHMTMLEIDIPETEIPIAVGLKGGLHRSFPIPTPRIDYTGGVEGFFGIDQIKIMQKEMKTLKKTGEKYITFYATKATLPNMVYIGSICAKTGYPWSYTKTFQQPGFTGNINSDDLLTVVDMEHLEKLMKVWETTGEKEFKMEMKDEYPVTFTSKYGNRYFEAPYLAKSVDINLYTDILKHIENGEPNTLLDEATEML